MPLDSDEPNRKLAVGEYLAPAEIRLKDGRLFWQPVDRWRKVKPTKEILTQFVNLANGSDGDVLMYAKRWGPLGLCEHYLPVSHSVSCVRLERRRHPEGEPVLEWKRLARNAGAILRISAQLRSGRDNLGKAEDWEILRAGPKEFRLHVLNLEAEEYIRPKKRVVEEKTVIAEIVNICLDIGNVRPKLTWSSPDPAVNLDGGPGGRLFGALAIQLLERAGGYEIAACTGCRNFFDVSAENRERRPKSGQGRYCPDCQQSGVPVRLAKQRVRAGLSKPRKR